MIELSARPWIRRLLLSRWPQWIATSALLAGFLYAILAGFLGTPVGSRNLAITAVWILWWGLLILLLVPFGGRAWCSVCPIPAPGDWLQRGGLTAADGRRSAGLGRRWPKALRNLWPQNVGFLLMAIFSTVILTTPIVTAAVLLGLLVLAFAVSIFFERRTFCRYLCPVGGFIGLYSLASPLALRVRDPRICKDHPTRECYHGSPSGHGCPWMIYPGALDRNAPCGLCMECLRTCPLDNVSLVLRLPGSDLKPRGLKPPLKVDEAYKGFIMLGAALLYSGVLLGPWGSLKMAAYAIGSPTWWLYAAAVMLLTLVFIPGLYLLAGWSGSRLAQRRFSVRSAFLRGTTGLVPLGLLGWAAFSLSFILINGSYIFPALSDPLGLGWNLFGGAHVGWNPLLSGQLPGMQGVLLLAGLGWATVITLRAFAQGKTSPDWAAASPALLANLLIAAAFLWLYL